MLSLILLNSLILRKMENITIAINLLHHLMVFSWIYNLMLITVYLTAHFLISVFREKWMCALFLLFPLLLIIIIAFSMLYSILMTAKCIFHMQYTLFWDQLLLISVQNTSFNCFSFVYYTYSKYTIFFLHINSNVFFFI